MATTKIEEKLFAFSPEELATYRTLQRSVGRSKQNIAIADVREKVNPSPDFYVAKPQDSGGLPARSGDTPGSGECDLYRLDTAGTSTVAEDLIIVANQSRKVYNALDEIIEQDYIHIQRDSYGIWWVVAGKMACP